MLKISTWFETSCLLSDQIISEFATTVKSQQSLEEFSLSIRGEKHDQVENILQNIGALKGLKKYSLTNSQEDKISEKLIPSICQNLKDSLQTLTSLHLLFEKC